MGSTLIWCHYVALLQKTLGIRHRKELAGLLFLLIMVSIVFAFCQAACLRQCSLELLHSTSMTHLGSYLHVSSQFYSIPPPEL